MDSKKEKTDDKKEETSQPKEERKEEIPEAPTANEKVENTSIKLGKSDSKSKRKKKEMVQIKRPDIGKMKEEANDKGEENTSEQVDATRDDGAKMSAEAKADMEKEIAELKEEENDKKRLMDDISSYKNTGPNVSVKSVDFYFSMKQYMCESSEAQKELGIYKFEYIVSPDGAFLYRIVQDCYGGHKFKDRIEFWQKREIYVAKLFISALKIRFKMKYTETEKYTGYMHWLEDQYMMISQEEYASKLGSNSVQNGRVWSTAWKRFYTDRTLANLGSQSLGNNTVLVRRSINTFFDQRAFIPLELPYLERCFTSIQDIYSNLRQFNLAGNYFTIAFDKETITSDKNIGLVYQEVLPQSTTLFTAIATRIPQFRNFMYLKARSIVDSLIELKTSSAAENVRILADNLNLVLNNVANVNAIPQDVFSANAKDIFNTLVAGCLMNRVFRFVYDINPSGAHDLTTWASIFAYLIYVPNPLLDLQTVFRMKTYLWTSLLGAYGIAEVNIFGFYGAFGFFNPLNPDATVPAFAYVGPVPIRNVAFNSAIPGVQTWQQFANNPAFGGAIKDFFAHPFARQNNQPNGDITMWTGLDRFQRYTIVVNFIRAVTSLAVQKFAITNNQRNQVVGFATMLREQYVQYGQYTLYMENVVRPINRLGIFDFDSGEVPQNLEINYDKFLALTVKMNYFRADFVNTWYKTVAWSTAVKVEIGLAFNIYLHYWRNDNYYSDVNRTRNVIQSRGDLMDFLKPVMSEYRQLLSTDEALWVFDNLPMYMSVTPPVNDPNIIGADILGLAQNVDIYREVMIDLESECGYVSQVVFNGLSDVRAGNGMQYICTASDIGLNPIVRRDFTSDYDPNPSRIDSDDMDFYPIARTVIKFVDSPHFTDEDTIKIINQLRDGNSIVEVPIYVRWASNSNIFTDLILTKPPLVMARESQNLVLMTNADDDRDATALVRFFNNRMDDVKFACASDFDTFFKSIRIH